MLVDLAALQWWQAATAIVIALGLSPAPWLYAMSRGLIQFTRVAERQHDKLVAALEAHHTAIVAALVAHHADEMRAKNERIAELSAARGDERRARIEERARAEKATDQLAEGVKVQNLVLHALDSLNEAARDAS